MIFIVNEDGTSRRLTGTVWLPESVIAQVEETEWGQYVTTKGGKKYWIPGDAAKYLIEEADKTSGTVQEYESDLISRHNEYEKEFEDDS